MRGHKFTYLLTYLLSNALRDAISDSFLSHSRNQIEQPIFLTVEPRLLLVPFALVYIRIWKYGDVLATFAGQSASVSGEGNLPRGRVRSLSQCDALGGPMAASSSFISRQRTWIRRRYCVVVAILLYVACIGAFIPLLSFPTPKSRQVQAVDPAAVTEPTVATREHSAGAGAGAAVPFPAAARRPLDVGAAAGDGASTKPSTKKPTELEVLHRNMTLHKANMSDLLKHVKAANRSIDVYRPGNRKVNDADDF